MIFLKKSLSFILALVLISSAVCLPAMAADGTGPDDIGSGAEKGSFLSVIDSGTCGDNLTWEIDEDKTITITGSGPMYDCEPGKQPWYSYTDSLSAVVIDGATTVGAYAFAGFQQIRNVSLSDGITVLAEWSFATCKSLQEITIPAGVTTIGNYVFGNCTGLEKIVFTGDAPSMKSDTFGMAYGGAITSTAYYPSGNDTWTSDKLQNYGGTITWVAYTEADKEDLEALIAQAQELNGDAYTTSSWNALQTALSAAEEIDQDVIASQDDVDAAAGALSAAIDGLAEAANKTALKELIDEADALHETAYTEDSWNVLQQALTNARTVYNDGDADQNTVDAAAATLQDAINGLVSILLGSGRCGENLFWELDRYGNLMISGTGTMYDYDLQDNQAPWTGMDVVELTIEEGASSIGTYAFTGLTTLTYADITDTVMSIGDYAFAGDTGLEYVVFSGDNGTAPTFGESCFSDVTAVVYYPDNSAWKNVTDGTYGGELTWVEYIVGQNTETFTFQWDAGGGYTRFSVCLFDQNENPINGSRASSGFPSNSHDQDDDTAYTFSITDFVKNYVVLSEDSYTFSYATVSDPNITDTAHEAYEGMQAQYGSSIDPVETIKLNWTQPSGDTSKTWHYTMYCLNGNEYTVGIYGNQNGAADSSGTWCPYYLELNLYFEKEADKTGLEAAIAEAGALEEENYTPASWEALAEALTAAIAVDEDESASQHTVDKTLDALNEAMGALVKAADKTDLEEAIEEADKLDPSDYTTSSWTAFEEVLEAAEQVYADPNASQDDVDKAVQTLSAAREGLIAVADKTGLIAAIRDARAKLDEGTYTEESKAALESVLAAAQTVVDDPDATEEEVSAMIEAVENAAAALTETETPAEADKSTLNDAINAAKKKLDDGTEYTAESREALEAVLADAEAVAADANATQDEVDAMAKALDAAVNALAEAGTTGGQPNGVRDGFVYEDGEWHYYDKGTRFTGDDIREDLNKAIDGTDGWYYIVSGKVDFSYTGVSHFANDYGWWYINNGKVDFSCNSVEQNQYGWWYVLGGKVDFSYIGVSNYSNAYGWWYIEKGKVNFGKTSIEPNRYGWWRVVDGKVDFSCNSVEQNSYGWWYVTGGKVDYSYTGVSNYSNAYGWWYIENGKVNFSKTGIEQNRYGWWRVVKGKVDFSCNSVEQNQWGWWYVLDGKVQFGYTGVANYANAYGWWYIKEGKVDFTYTGTASNNYGTWNVVNGKVVF